MARMTRRGALKLASTAGLGLAMAVGQATGAAPAPDKPALFVVQPYSFGELYRTMKDPKERKELRDIFENGKSPPGEDIAQSLDNCTIYLIDQRVGEGPKSWRFPEDDEGYPKVTVEGMLFHKLQDKAGKDFTIQLRSIKTAGWSLHQKTQPPYREFNLAASLEFRGWTDNREEYCVYGIILRHFAYDVTGEHRQV